MLRIADLIATDPDTMREAGFTYSPKTDTWVKPPPHDKATQQFTTNLVKEFLTP